MKIRLFLIGFFLILIPLIVSEPYYLHLLILIGIFSVVSIGVVLQLSAGSTTIGSAAFWGIGAYASALLTLKLGLPFYFCLPLAGVISAVFSLGIGILIVNSGYFGFIMLTVAVNGILVEVLGRTSLFGGWDGLSGISSPKIHIPFYGLIEFANKISYYYLILFLLLLTVIVFYALYESRIGTAWKIIGSAPTLAASIGVNIFRYKLAAFVIAGFFAGSVGSFYSYYQGFVVPNTFDIWPSVLFLIYPIVGGMDYKIAGPIAGASLCVIAPEILRITELFEPIFLGLVLISTVMFLPGGVLSLAKKILTCLEILSKRIELYFGRS